MNRLSIKDAMLGGAIGILTIISCAIGWGIYSQFTNSNSSVSENTTPTEASVTVQSAAKKTFDVNFKDVNDEISGELDTSSNNSTENSDEEDKPKPKSTSNKKTQTSRNPDGNINTINEYIAALDKYIKEIDDSATKSDSSEDYKDSAANGSSNGKSVKRPRGKKKKTLKSKKQKKVCIPQEKPSKLKTLKKISGDIVNGYVRYGFKPSFILPKLVIENITGTTIIPNSNLEVLTIPAAVEEVIEEEHTDEYTVTRITRKAISYVVTVVKAPFTLSKMAVELALGGTFVPNERVIQYRDQPLALKSKDIPAVNNPLENNVSYLKSAYNYTKDTLSKVKRWLDTQTLSNAIPSDAIPDDEDPSYEEASEYQSVEDEMSFSSALELEQANPIPIFPGSLKNTTLNNSSASFKNYPFADPGEFNYAPTNLANPNPLIINPASSTHPLIHQPHIPTGSSSNVYSEQFNNLSMFNTGLPNYTSAVGPGWPAPPATQTSNLYHPAPAISTRTVRSPPSSNASFQSAKTTPLKSQTEPSDDVTKFDSAVQSVSSENNNP